MGWTKRIKSIRRIHLIVRTVKEEGLAGFFLRFRRSSQYPFRKSGWRPSGFIFRIVFIIPFLWPASAVAVNCGSQNITIYQGESVTYTLIGNGSTLWNFQVASSSSPFASISPPSISSALDGVFTITGLSRGSATFAVVWKCPITEDSGTCNINVAVLEGESGGSQGSTPSSGGGVSQGSTSTGPKILSEPKRDIFVDVIPKPPRYGEHSGGGSGEEEKPKTPAGPMVSKGLMDHIRSFTKSKEAGDQGNPKGSGVTETPGQSKCCCLKKIVFRNTTDLPVKFSLSGPAQPTEIAARETFTVMGDTACINISFWYPDPDRGSVKIF